MDAEMRAFEARCSFCRKGQGDVIALTAGPGVFICNECVALVNGLLRELGPVEKKVPYDAPGHFRGMDSQRLLGLVGQIDHVYQDVANQQQLIVDVLRERQVSWAAIGESLGVTRQAAWRRFATGPDLE